MSPYSRGSLPYELPVTIAPVGTPVELYERPRSLFVAGFIGSPKMNFLTGKFAEPYGACTIGVRSEHIQIGPGEGAWMGKVGSAMADPGAPFGARTAVSDNGSSPAPSDQNGYSIVEAESLEAARAFTDGHPFLSEGKGRFTVEIFELVPM